jgi:hypothetical protein
MLLIQGLCFVHSIVGLFGRGFLRCVHVASLILLLAAPVLATLNNLDRFVELDAIVYIVVANIKETLIRFLGCSVCDLLSSRLNWLECVPFAG